MLLQAQQTAKDIFQQLPAEVGISLLTALIIFLLTLLSKRVRQFLFYKRHEFGLEYNSDFRACEYDVQWEGFRLTIEVGDVHNEYLSGVVIKRNGENPGRPYSTIEIGKKFTEIPEWGLYFKLNSIIRTKSQTGIKEFKIYFVVKRRRW